MLKTVPPYGKPPPELSTTIASERCSLAAAAARWTRTAHRADGAKPGGAKAREAFIASPSPKIVSSVTGRPEVKAVSRPTGTAVRACPAPVSPAQEPANGTCRGACLLTG